MMNEKIEFSIIIPSHNRPQQLTDCLRSISEVEYPRERFEVIVVDDESAVSPETIIAQFQKDLPVKLLSQEHAGPAAARNRGGMTAAGNFLIFLDDDCQPAKNWLQKLSSNTKDSADVALGGKTLNALNDNIYSSASQFLIDYLYAYYNQQPERAVFFASNNLVVPAALFRRIGGFDSRFPLAAGEDREFCDRWLRHGYRLRYVPEVIVYHAHALSLRRFIKQHFNYGRGAFCFHRLHAEQGSGQIKIEKLSFYRNLLLYPFSRTTVWRTLRIFFLLVISQVAIVCGFLFEKYKAKSRRQQIIKQTSE